MRPPGDDDVIRYTLLDETGPHDVLLFGCEKCPPDKKLTSSMLETHMRDRHDSARFTVSVPSPVTDLTAIIKVDGVLTKEEVKNAGQNSPERKGPRRYDRPVPGQRQPRRD